MIYVRMDISKYKRYCFICKDTGEVFVENLFFANISDFETLNKLSRVNFTYDILLNFKI